MQNVSTGKGKSSYYSAMPGARGLKFYYVIADPKVGEQLFAQNSLNAIVFKLQVILLMEVSEKSKSSYYSLSY